MCARSAVEASPQDGKAPLPTSAAKSDPFADWIAELSSDQYSQRLRAARELWSAGSAAVKPLTNRLKFADRDESLRINNVLALINSKLSPDIPDEIAVVAARFSNVKYYERYELAAQLMLQGYDDLLIHLVESLPFDEQLATISDENWMGTLTEIAVQQSNWDRLDRLFSLDSVQILMPHRTVCFFLDRGLIDQKIVELQSSLAEKDASSSDRESVGRRKLILLHLLAAVGRESEIEPLLANEAEGSDVTVSYRALQRRQSTWQQLADRLRSANAAESNSLKTELGPIGEMLVYRWADQPELCHERLTTLLDDAALTKLTKTNALIASLSQPIGEPYLAELSKANTFALMCWQGRIDDAFRFIGLPAEIEQRNKWFDRQIRNMKSLYLKFERTGDDETDLHFQDQFDLLQSIATQLGSLGLTREASYWLQKIAAAFATADYRGHQSRQRIVQALVGIGCYREARELVVSSDSDDVTDLIETLYPHTENSLVAFWNEQLTAEFPDLAERIARIDDMLPFSNPSNIAQRPKFDVESLLSYAFKQPEQAGNLKRVAETCRLNDRDDLAEALLQDAIAQFDSDAIGTAAQAAFEHDDVQRAAQLYELAWKNRLDSNTAFRCFACYLKLGQTETADKYWQRAIYCGVRDVDWYDVPLELFGQFDPASTQKLTHLLQACRLDSQPPPELLKVLTHVSAVDLRDQQTRQLQDRLLSFVGEGEPSRYSLYIADSACEIDADRVVAKIESGEIPQAVEIARQIMAFSPVNTAALERILPKLRAAGATAEADALMKQFEDAIFAILRQYPDASLYLNNYGWLCALNDYHLGVAREFSQKTVDADPINPSYLDTLAEIEFRLGHVAHAVELSQKCVKIDGDNDSYRRQLDRFRQALNAAK